MSDLQKQIYKLPSLKETISQYSISAKKKLGQNFILDLDLTDKISRLGGSIKDELVIEIGPGIGSLTRMLLANGAYVIAVEKDRNCIDALRNLKNISGDRLNIIEGDALYIDEEKILLQHKFHPPVKIIANLPYNIATELLLKWLKKPELFKSLTLMFQKEVAERINARPSTKDYGRLSIISQWLCEVSHNFDISPSVFFPPPKVESSVITLTPRKSPLYKANRDVLEKLCKAAFGQRRKMLRASLRQITDNPHTLLNAACIEETKRPEELTIEQFCTLARAFEYWCLNKN